MSSLLRVEDLRIENRVGRPVVDGVTFEVEPGEALGLVGESGSGKTTTGLAVLGWIRPGLRLGRGRITIDGEEMLGRSERELRRRRGRVVAYVPQSPGTALNPSLRVRAQIAEVARHRERRLDGAFIGSMLELVNLPSDRRFQRRFPHQLSGGQLQRLGIAVALACGPRLLVLDEPTTGLDVVIQQLVLDEVDRIRNELGVAMISISHDLALVARRTDRLIVMRNGGVIEAGPSRTVLSKPAQPYTKLLVDAVPDPRRVRSTGDRVRANQNGRDSAVSLARHDSDVPLLAVAGLCAIHRGRYGTVVAADDVSFTMTRGECLALVGESGSGKTTIARSLIGLHELESGEILLDGVSLRPRAAERTLDQRRRIQIVFQDPFDSLNPRRSSRDSILRPLRYLAGLDRKAANSAVDDLLERVRLPRRLAAARPFELSGGECQRVAIARALAAKPDLLVCDEITSALDTSVQASVLELLDELRIDLGLSLLFISHDLGVVASIADQMMVLDHGIACECGDATRVLTSPSHPYTQRLLAAAPSLSSALAGSLSEDPRSRLAHPIQEA